MSLIRKIGRAYNLARYHRAGQLSRRAIKIVRDRVLTRLPNSYRPRTTHCQFKENATELLCEQFQRRSKLWPEKSQTSRIAEFANGKFTFLNEARDLKIDGPQTGCCIDWNPDATRLWRFHLQSHEYLLQMVACGFQEQVWQLVDSWIESPRHQTPFLDPDAWHPFCLSRRLPIWLMIAAAAPPPEIIASKFWKRMAEQIQWLADNKELDLGGNHLLENLHTLIMCTAFTDGDWQIDEQGLLPQFKSQCSEQILPTGEHFERTPTYHAVMILALTETAEAIEFQGDDASWVWDAIANMKDLLVQILHPDGNIPLLGDSALDETPSPSVLLQGHVPDPDFSAKDYWTWRSPNEDFLLCDIGPLACDYLPAHGHCDLLNIEASIAGQRVIVDTGTFDYEATELRQQYRSTAAHNTLQVDGIDHADTWSSFRMGRRGHPIWNCCGKVSNLDWMCAAHDAYSHLKIPAIGRMIVAKPGPFWLVIDWILAPGRHELASRIHFHPQLNLTEIEPKKWSVDMGNLATTPCVVQTLNATSVSISNSFYSPSFGVKESNQCLTLNRTSDGTEFIAWAISPNTIDTEFSVSVEQTTLCVSVDGTQIQQPLAR